MKLQISDCEMKTDAFSLRENTRYGVIATVPEAIAKAQKDLRIEQIIKDFKGYVDEVGVLQMPQLTGIPDSNFQSLEVAGNTDTCQGLHRDYGYYQYTSAFLLKKSRARHGTLVVPEEMAEKDGFPEDAFQGSQISAITQAHRKVIAGQYGLVLNQSPGLTLVSNESCLHGRTIINPKQKIETEGVLQIYSDYFQQ